ncbi:MAG: Ku protein [Deltaproteobacteria bacterium]|nr:Ku protein [Deltaproteobacteria bacterium]
MAKALVKSKTGDASLAGRALWKGEIRFGEIAVPVKLHAAIHEERIGFHLLHRRDGVRLKQQMVCARDGATVPAEEQVRGFEVEEGKYLLVDPEELDAAEPAESRRIEVHEFVAAGQIDPLFLERVYTLEADRHEKSYNALAAILGETDVAGICTWTMRKRSYLGALEACGRVLRLNTLRYADEVIPARSLELPEIALTEKELQIGSELINRLTAPFEPEKFADEHQQKLRRLIEQKARGEKIVLLPPRQRKPTAPDKLLEALRASLKKVA